MNLKYIPLFLILLASVGIVSASDVIVSDSDLFVNQEKYVNVMILNADDGLAGYNMTASCNSSIATISGYEFPSWATMTNAGTVPTGSLNLMAVDLGNAVTGGDIQLCKLILQGISEGDTNISLTFAQLDSDAGTTISTTITGGSVAVSGRGRTRATEPIETLDDTQYTNLLASFGGDSEDYNATFDWMAVPGSVLASYQGVWGDLATVMIFAIPFFMMWLMHRNLLPAAVFGTIWGSYLFVYLPEEYYLPGVAFIAMGITATLYGLLKIGRD